MGHPMMNHPGHEHGQDWSRMFLIPIPMAMFGVLISFMFGAVVGHAMARKHAPMGPGVPGPMGRGEHFGPMAWKHGMGMRMGMGAGMGMGIRHHHHGDGPACCCSEPPEHPAEPAGEEPAMEE